MAPPIVLKVGETEAKRTHADVLNSFFGAHLAPRGHRRVFYPLKTDAAQVWFPVFCEEASVDARVMERFKKTGWANVLSENGTRLTETLLAREDDTSDRARMARKLETLEKYPPSSSSAMTLAGRQRVIVFWAVSATSANPARKGTRNPLRSSTSA